MAVVVLVVVMALVAAVLVLVIARAEGAGDRSVGPLRAFRRGLAAPRHPDAEQRAQARAASAVPVDVSLGEMLQATVERGEGYLQPGEVVRRGHSAA